MRDFGKEMLTCFLDTMGRRGCSVKVTCADGTVFRCKPAISGGVILFKGKARRQYTHLERDEWVRWAEEVDTPRVR